MEKIVTLGVITTKVAISFHKITSERSELDLIYSRDNYILLLIITVDYILSITTLNNYSSSSIYI